MTVRRLAIRAAGGMALVVVLWLLALLSVIAFAYSASVRTELRLGASHLQGGQARALAGAGIHHAIAQVARRRHDPMRAGGVRRYTFRFAEHEVRVRIEDEAGKIDLNSAHPALLSGLLSWAGVKERERRRLVDAMLDWRDRDRLARNRGAEDEDYAAAGLHYGAKDGPYNSVDELLRVQGVTPELYRKLRPALTVYSHQAGIHPHVAAREVLLALPGVTAAAVDRYLEERERRGTLARLAGVEDTYLAVRRGDIYRVTGEAEVGAVVARIGAVLELRLDKALPYEMLTWYEDASPLAPPPTEPAR